MATPKWIADEGRWRLDTRINGKRYQFSSSTPGKAGERTVKRQEKAIRDGQADRSTWRLQKCWDEYIERVKAVSSFDNHHQRKSYGDNYILPALKHRKVGTILRGDWQDVVDAGYAAGLAKKSLQNLRSTIVNFCRYGIDHGMVEYIPTNPALVIPKGARKVGKKILPPEMVKRLWTLEEQWFLYYWQFLLVMGLRPGEVFGIKWSDIVGNTVTIRRAVNWRGHVTTGKNENATSRDNELRDFEMPPLALEIIAAQRAMLKRLGIISPYVFPRKTGQRSAQQQSGDDFRAIFGSEFKPYCLRHTHYSATRKKMPEAWSRMWLGQTEDMDTDAVYGHTVPEEIKGAANIIEGVFREMIG